MSFKTKLLYDYNIDDISSVDNEVSKLITPRSDLIGSNYELPIVDRQLTGIYANRAYVWMRTDKIKETEIRIEDHDLIWYHTPMRAGESDKKIGARFILDVGTLGIGYWYSSKKILESVNFIDNPKNDPESKEFIQAGIIANNILHGLYIGLSNILQNKTTKKVEYINNDVLIDGKKICGGDEMLNHTGTYQVMGINYHYNDEFFKEVLSTDEYHRQNNFGITGISNEIPGYSREEFSEEWMAEVVRLVEEAEEFIDD